MVEIVVGMLPSVVKYMFVAPEHEMVTLPLLEIVMTGWLVGSTGVSLLKYVFDTTLDVVPPLNSAIAFTVVLF